jgi:hypothetical protein
MSLSKVVAIIRSKLFEKTILIVTSIVTVGYTIYDHTTIPKHTTEQKYILKCPESISNKNVYESFKISAFDIWKQTKNNDSSALIVWKKTFDDLVYEINNKTPSSNGVNKKASALLCLKSMSQAGDSDNINLELKKFDMDIDALGKNNWDWIVNQLATDVKINPPEGFEIWRENLYAKALAGDLKSQNDINFLQQNGFGSSL